MELSFEEKFTLICTEVLNNTSFDKRGYEKEYVNRYKFKTRNSADIKYGLLVEAEKSIDRSLAKIELQKYVVMEHIVDQIEKGLFEFSLIHVTINKLQNHFVKNVYEHKLYDLCVNLDVDDTNVENYTLLVNIVSGTFDPYLIAFFPPDMLHPKNWASLHLKKQIQDDAINSLQTTDIYKCSRCGERKFKMSEIQLRSADEASSKILTCMVCFKTFII